ncbi:TolC family protein [Neolewinella antarctica]|uniref:Outer membrane protein TolC n=1 Tax=Neolewinella antarctica TaxID=442734 RepID=A0ABX0X7T8_9BACT|nr:TolC family protein [Neolewinella antarctica]NJC25049.1 outer membrane protein TolC [Neolewinella antarctica]
MSTSAILPNIPRTRVRALLLCVLATTGLSAQRSLSLSDAIQEGLANNYQIRLSRADLAVAENNDSYSLTDKYPTISLGVTPQVSYRDNVNPASIVAQSTVVTYGVGPAANLNWTLFNGGRVEIAKDQLATVRELSEGQLQVQVENSVAQIIQAYYNTVVQQEQIDVRQRVLNLSRDQVEYQNVRRDFGRAGTFDELQAKDAYLTDSTQLVLQQLNYEVATQNLLQVLGSDNINEPLTLTTELKFDDDRFDETALVQRLEANNSQLRTLATNRALAGIQTELIQTEYKPTVALVTGLGYDFSVATGTQTFDFNDDRPSREVKLPGFKAPARTLSGNIGFGVNYLLYDGKNRKVREQSARLEELTSKLEYDATNQQLRTQLLNAVARHNNQTQLVNITQDLIANAERNITIAEERFRGGTINSFDYRIIQVNLVNAEFQLLNALLNLKNTETEVLRLTGQVVQ